MSALTPDCWKRCFNRFALSGSLNVAIVTICLFCPIGVTLSTHQLAAKRKARGREPMVKNEVNEDACDRDVKPDRHRPTSKAAVLVPPALKNRNEGDNH